MSGLRIADVRVHVVDTERKPLVFVRVETESGAIGVGEAASNTDAETVATAIERAADDLAGADPFATEDLFTTIFESSVLTRRGVSAGPNDVTHTSAASALDVAMWDLKGKHCGLPVSDLLGGAVNGDRLRAYANGWWQDCYRAEADPDPARFADAAADVIAGGYEAVKFNPFGAGPGWLDRATADRAAERVAAVREAVGPDADVFVEGHKQLTPSAAAAFAARIESYAPGFYEEPTPPRPADLARVAAKTSVPVATGESLLTHHGFQALLAEGSVGVVQPDPVRAGGITELSKIVAMADAAGVSFAPHNACGPVSTAACAHLAAAAPNFAVQEVFVDGAYPDWVADLFVDSVVVDDGYLGVPDGPGLGVEMDWNAVRERERER